MKIQADESSGLMSGGKPLHTMRRKSVSIGIKCYKLVQNVLIHLQNIFAPVLPPAVVLALECGSSGQAFRKLPHLPTFH